MLWMRIRVPRGVPVCRDSMVQHDMASLYR